MSDLLAKIILRRGTAAQWALVNPILDSGEEGHETDTNKRKVGDGVTAWNALPYFGGSSSPAWGVITGTLSAQTDLQAALDAIETLAKKRQLFLYKNTTVTVTGTVAMTIMTPNTFIIPGGTLGANSVLSIRALFSKTGTGGNCNIRVYINTSYAIGGVQFFDYTPAAANRGAGIQIQHIVNKNSVSSQEWNVITNSQYGDTVTSNVPSATAINWAVDQYIMITYTPGSASDTPALNNVQIYIEHPAS